jgi:hypothetical protein
VKEICVVPTFRRPELLACCLKRIRAAEPDIPISVFPDRGTIDDPQVQEVLSRFTGIETHFVPQHTYHGNSYNAGEALRFAYNSGYDLIHYIEDDFFIKPDLFEWTRSRHERFDDVFCSAGWVFNLHSPIDSGDYFVPWIYIPQFSIRRDKLKLVLNYLRPSYYADMQGFMQKQFSGCKLNGHESSVIAHYEIDGLIQRIITDGKYQVLWPSVAKGLHRGGWGYNRGWTDQELLLGASSTLDERITKVEELASDEYWCAEVFSRKVVEREIGHVLPRRNFRYEVRLPSGWTSEYVSELPKRQLPRKINGVTLSPEAEIISL